MKMMDRVEYCVERKKKNYNNIMYISGVSVIVGWMI